jgi:hypothetical protein
MGAGDELLGVEQDEATEELQLQLATWPRAGCFRFGIGIELDIVGTGRCNVNICKPRIFEGKRVVVKSRISPESKKCVAMLCSSIREESC